MAVGNVKRLAGPFTGAGIKVLPFGFKIFEPTDVFVALAEKENDPPKNLEYNADYSVEMNQDQEATPGGTVTLTNALNETQIVSVGTDIPYTQTTQLTNYIRFPPEVINTALDRTVVQIQQLVDLVNRALITDPTDTITPRQLRDKLLEAASSALDAAAKSKEYADKLLAFKDQIVTVSDNIKSVGITAENAEAIAEIAKNLEELLKSKDYAAEAKGWAEKANAITGGQAIVAAGTTFPRSPIDRFADVVNVKDFGARGKGTTDDTEAIQAAVAECPSGGALFFPAGQYAVSDEIRIEKPMLIFGSGQGNIYAGLTNPTCCVRQINTGKSIFVLVAQKGLAFPDSYWIDGVDFKNIQLCGKSNDERAVSAITTDTTVNDGNYVVRYCNFDGVATAFFSSAIELGGIAHINTFQNLSAAYCDTAWKFVRGNAPDTGGQTRFFGCSAVACGTVASLYEGTSNGDFAFFGCTLSESHYGIRANNTCALNVIGCTFEALKYNGQGAGIYIDIRGENPNSQAQRVILGNKMLRSDADIWVDKKTSAFSGGGFTWAMYIEGNTLLSETSLKVTVPEGHEGIDSPLFVFGASNTGLNNGRVADSQISENFKGCDMRRWAAKSAPESEVVGKTDEQTLKNKSFSQDELRLTSTGYKDATLTISTPSGVKGNRAILRLADNNGAEVASVVGYGTAYGTNLSGVMGFRLADGTSLQLKTSVFSPMVGYDNVIALGEAPRRWSQLFAATATINTSDARCKENVAAPDDALMRAWGKVGFRVFQFKDAVEKKGSGARIHVGVIAQEVKAAFESEGLDASRYGLFCHDAWEDEYEDVEVIDEPEVVDDEGNVTPAKTHIEHRLVTPAGDRYGIRYEEALALEAAYQRWRLAQIEARL